MSMNEKITDLEIRTETNEITIECLVDDLNEIFDRSDHIQEQIKELETDQLDTYQTLKGVNQKFRTRVRALEDQLTEMLADMRTGAEWVKRLDGEIGLLKERQASDDRSMAHSVEGGLSGSAIGGDVASPQPTSYIPERLEYHISIFCKSSLTRVLSLII